jgi:hypothetical protein
MYRIRLPGGGLSDLYNLSWAKQHLASGRFANPTANDNRSETSQAA